MADQIGASPQRVEDLPLITGRATYAADIALPGQLSAHIVRSPVAHGRIVEIDVSEARAHPGCIAVLTAADLVDDLGSVPVIQPRVSFDEAVVPYLQPVLATDRVRYVGEPVAVVVAANRYVAEDVADLVFVDIDPLSACVSAPAASDGDDLFPEGNEVVALTASFGDPAVFETAPIVVSRRLTTGRHSGVPMETRGMVVEIDAVSGGLVIYGSTKVPHSNRSQLARHLKMSPQQIRMKETSVGGGFGVRGEFYPEDLLIPWAARRVGRPLSWIEDRREHFIAANHSREQVHDATIAGDEEGNILGIRSEFWADMGAYVRTHGIRVPDLTLSMLPGPYDIETYVATAHCMVTNRTPTATYRAPGRFESCFVRERLIDMYAGEAGLDPIEVRRRNLIKPGQMPFSRQLLSTGEPVVYNEGDYPKMLATVAERLDLGSIERRRQQGEVVGAGLAMFLEKSGLGPWESGSVRVGRDGRVLVRSGCSSVGQGLRTVLAQIAADAFEVPLEDVRVEMLDTDHTSYGTGSYASRSTATAGSAVLLACERVVEQAKRFVSHELEVDPKDLVIRAGGVEVNGAPDLRRTLGQIVQKLDPVTASRLGVDPGLFAQEYFHVKKLTYPYGCHAAIVSIDSETGAPRVERLILGYDVGKAVNPMLVEGQLHGGALQGLGGALYEQMVFDEDGNPLVTSFMDYLMPTSAEAPLMTAIITEDAPTDTNPLGVKGAGEGGLTGVAAAVASAIDSALGKSGSVTSVPVDPASLVQRTR